MNINLEANELHSIRSYSSTAVEVNSQIYTSNFIVSRQEIITSWPLESIQSLTDETLAPLLKHQPEIILIGHNHSGQWAPASITGTLMNQRIALECMSIGAACRTFNVLLGEGRAVVLGIVF